MFQSFDLGRLILGIIPVLLAITVHEASHGYAAKRCGDNTAQMMGRLTLNPLKHIDPIGSVVLPLLMFLTTPFIFGWAKPVPIQPRNFKNMRLGIRFVSVAGPLSNLVMAVLWGLVVIIASLLPENYGTPLIIMSNIGIEANITLFVLNMIPLLPLDGGRFVETFLPARASIQFQKIEPYGIWILLALLVSGILGRIIEPFFLFFYDLIWAGISLVMSLFVG